MEKILITGSTGFIGKHLLVYLSNPHKHLCCLVRNTHKTVPTLPTTQIVADLENKETLKNICTGVDTIFHLAGFAHASGEHAEKHHQINFLGAQYLMDESIRAGVKRFIFFSTVKAMDKHDQTPYAIAKRQAEEYILNQAQKNNIHACVIRPALVYGPGVKGNLASMINAIDRHLFLPVPETGNRRSLASVKDVCRAAILASEDPRANGRVYAVTDNIAYSTRQIYTLMRQGLGLSVPRWSLPLFVFKSMAVSFDYIGKIINKRFPLNKDSLAKLFDSAFYSSEAIQKELGFKPKDSFERMMPEMIAEYRHECLQKLIQRKT